MAWKPDILASLSRKFFDISMFNLTLSFGSGDMKVERAPSNMFEFDAIMPRTTLQEILQRRDHGAWSRHLPKRQYRIAVTMWCCLTICMGCGGPSGPQRVSVSGKIVVDNKPLAGGSISFLPAEGHRGPAANGIVMNGRYQISATEGPTAGPHVATIHLIPGKNASGTSLSTSSGKPPKTQWEVKVQVDDKGSPLDFSLKEAE